MARLPQIIQAIDNKGQREESLEPIDSPNLSGRDKKWVRVVEKEDSCNKKTTQARNSAALAWYNRCTSSTNQPFQSHAR